ncbi:hypothetical protein GCM10010987_59580 [Bradyrhizobium guangdongense]|uniref:Uncharacterized protein n=1 Tax=Bradyrhizobium guangdongense TaxID=1325090 RepID=A0AA88BB37_9BRAD|nr:hypothetical protein GCM10010987_59580 [Bradyrhizobium guangdongense]
MLPGEVPALRATASALPSELARVLRQEPLKAEAEAAQPAAPAPSQAAEGAVSERAAAEPQPEAAVWGRAAAALGAEAASAHVAAALRPEAVVSEHAAAAPEAASAAWVQQAAAEAEEAPDELRAAEAAASGVTARQPAEVRQADAAVPPRAAVQSDGREPQAAEAASPDARRAAAPSALPSEAASVFRQGPSLAGPARPRVAARIARAMRSLRIASRSEPSWQAARNEGWSCGSTSPEGSLTKSGDERLRVRPHCGGRSGRGPIYFCTQITSRSRRSLRIQTLVAIAPYVIAAVSHAVLRRIGIRRRIRRERTVRSTRWNLFGDAARQFIGAR